MTLPNSFAELAESHRAEILAYLTRMLGHEQDAQDVCQDALLRACRAFGRLPSDANVRAWLYKIATNRAISALRRRRRRSARTVDAEPDGFPSPAGFGPDRREQLGAVHRAVLHLPPKQRAALMQRRFHEMGYAEIAASLGCSEASARANVYQAIKKLRAMLERPRQRRRANRRKLGHQ
jgi:RNA polymerase sigma-70 factor (ECF subfamily)